MTDLLNVERFGNFPTLMVRQQDYSINFLDSNISTALKTGVFERHLHITYEIIIVRSGFYQCTVNDVPLRLEEGELLIIQPGQQHEDFFEEGCSVYGFHFNITTASGKIGPLFFKPSTPYREQILNLKENEENLQFLQLLIKLLAMETAGAQNFSVCNSIFYSIFFKLLSLFPEDILLLSAETNCDRYLVDKVTGVFFKNLSRQPSLDELAVQCGMSRSSLNRFCLRRFNRSPHKAFMRYKILQSVEFMKKHPQISIKEVSHEFGFSTPFHFSRVFKEEIGSCPSHYMNGKKSSPAE